MRRTLLSVIALVMFGAIALFATAGPLVVLSISDPLTAFGLALPLGIVLMLLIIANRAPIAQSATVTRDMSTANSPVARRRRSTHHRDGSVDVGTLAQAVNRDQSATTRSMNDGHYTSGAGGMAERTWSAIRAVMSGWTWARDTHGATAT